MDDLLTVRKQVADYLRKQLLGPLDGDHEIVTEEPYKRYTTGVLYPCGSSMDAQQDEDEEDVAGVSGSSQQEDQADDPLVLANQYLPGSMGLSFYLKGDTGISVQVTGARYTEIQSEMVADESTKRKKQKRRWQRHPLVDSLVLSAPDMPFHKAERNILNDAARLNVVWRRGSHGWLVTVTVINNATSKNAGSPNAADCLHQIEVRCKKATEKGEIAAYPRVRMITEDKEEYFLEILYRRQVAYGVGHGCSVDWNAPENGTISEIWTDILPAQEVSPITYDLPGYEQVLSLYFLQASEHIQSPEMLIGKLKQFVEGYRHWIEQLPYQNEDIPPYLLESRDVLLVHLQVAYDRMKAGIELLGKDVSVRKAFCLANRAMLMQMMHSQEEYSGTRHQLDQTLYVEPKLVNAQDKKWRPFQLAFQLLTIASIAMPDDPFRQTVDLIWFPTGGGKTEAYLAVTAFLIFYRRLSYGASAAGTTVLMRYTLRLLTTQQFKRAATLICACEQLRKEDVQALGRDEIAIGLWVGEDTTPNTYQQASKAYQDLLKQDIPVNPFQMDRCPWCGTEIVPGQQSADRKVYGISSDASSFSLFCPRVSCPFHNKLPIEVVDQQLYDQPPALLLGTVDKFARMPWEGRVAEFFGGANRRPPELIIQDELHLISGPLGTIVGVYETAIDALTSWNGIPPKIIASTATIRRADEQCLGLYARDVAQFPPSGLDAADSYFARYDYKKPGRLYIGVLGAAHTASTTMIRTSAALLQAPIDLGLKGKALDAYWTLVGYHNSLRELGKSRTFGADDIPARIKVIAQDQKYMRGLDHDNVQELTSNIDAARLGEMLHRLERSANEKDEVSLLLCTNMLSVGVDVQRLGVMLVNGQPKSTSEYIQATSRVGRGNVPGLVVCVYAPSKPRDRSHYERFKAYHSSLYRQVEPTSVTPFAQPARERALHAVLVTLIRYKAGLLDENAAGKFSQSFPDVQRIAALIQQRVEHVDPREAAATARQMQRLMDEWDEWAGENGTMSYKSNHAAKDPLLVSPGAVRSNIGWPTLQSMRNVDRNCLIKVIGS